MRLDRTRPEKGRRTPGKRLSYLHRSCAESRCHRGDPARNVMAILMPLHMVETHVFMCVCFYRCSMCICCSTVLDATASGCARERLGIALAICSLRRISFWGCVVVCKVQVWLMVIHAQRSRLQACMEGAHSVTWRLTLNSFCFLRRSCLSASSRAICKGGGEVSAVSLSVC